MNPKKEWNFANTTFTLVNLFYSLKTQLKRQQPFNTRWFYPKQLIRLILKEKKAAIHAIKHDVAEFSQRRCDYTLEK